ncbi:MAG: EF-hand domain-containing protein [Boseongicola sp.]
MRFLVLTIASLAFANAVWAQTAVEDANGDGMYSIEELLTVFPNITDELFSEIDVNDDGGVDIEELAAAESAGLIVAG